MFQVILPDPSHDAITDKELNQIVKDVFSQKRRPSINIELRARELLLCNSPDLFLCYEDPDSLIEHLLAIQNTQSSQVALGHIHHEIALSCLKKRFQRTRTEPYKGLDFMCDDDGHKCSYLIQLKSSWRACNSDQVDSITRNLKSACAKVEKTTRRKAYPVVLYAYGTYEPKEGVESHLYGKDAWYFLTANTKATTCITKALQRRKKRLEFLQFPKERTTELHKEVNKLWKKWNVIAKGKINFVQWKQIICGEKCI